MVQQALAKPNAVTQEPSSSGKLGAFAGIALGLHHHLGGDSFITSHYIFRWRTAMNDYYVVNWQRLRHMRRCLASASRKTPCDLPRPWKASARALIDALMTLLAFCRSCGACRLREGASADRRRFPKRWSLSPSFGARARHGPARVAGIRLPGLEFRNQRVEAAYRKELVSGEQWPAGAQPADPSGIVPRRAENYFAST